MGRKFGMYSYTCTVVQYCTGIQVLQYMYCTAVSCVRGIRAICRWDVNQGLRVAKGIYAVGDLTPNITVEGSQKSIRLAVSEIA